jgi:hypothetical protein
MDLHKGTAAEQGRDPRTSDGEIVMLQVEAYQVGIPATEAAGVLTHASIPCIMPLDVYVQLAILARDELLPVIDLRRRWDLGPNHFPHLAAIVVLTRRLRGIRIGVLGDRAAWVKSLPLPPQAGSPGGDLMSHDQEPSPVTADLKPGGLLNLDRLFCDDILLRAAKRVSTWT